MTGQASTPGIVARDVCKSFGGHLVLDKVNLTAEEGTILALLGPNGAGKTSLLRMMATVLAPTSGRLRLLDRDPGDRECLARLAGVAARALGVVTRSDLIDYHRLRELTDGQAGHAELAGESALAAGLTPVEIEVAARPGTGRRARSTKAASTVVPGWADPAALAEAPRGRHRVTLLSPFDSLLWDRKRTRRMFGFEHTLEAYVPRAKRVHGYYAMPLLAGGRLIGRADPVRQGQTLVARQLSLDSAAAVTPMARALREAAEWVGCSAVEIGQVNRPDLVPRLRRGISDGALADGDLP